jgi:hypothetical protein
VFKYGEDEPIQLTKDRANRVHTYENEARSILTYFYASFMRGDEKWRKVVTPDDNNPEDAIVFDIYYRDVDILAVTINGCEINLANEGRCYVFAVLEYYYDGKRLSLEVEAAFILDNDLLKLDIIYSNGKLKR